MPIISSKDASALSYLARHRSVDSARATEMSAGLKGEALAVAKALTGKRGNKRASRSARALQDWADSNDQIALTISKRRR